VPGGGSIFAAYDLKSVYEPTDVFMYGEVEESRHLRRNTGDEELLRLLQLRFMATMQEDNQTRSHPRAAPLSRRQRQPSRAHRRNRSGFSRHPGYRMPRIVADLAAGGPSICESSMDRNGDRGEGPWIRGLRAVQQEWLLRARTRLLRTQWRPR